MWRFENNHELWVVLGRISLFNKNVQAIHLKLYGTKRTEGLGLLLLDFRKTDGRTALIYWEVFHRVMAPKLSMVENWISI